MKKLLIFILFFFVLSCGGVEFVYKDKKSLINPLYERTNVETSGKELVFIRTYTPIFFGKDTFNEFNLLIDIQEKQTKRSVEVNQATSNLRYELRFLYTLISVEKSCIVYEKEILSYFSIIPKSSGYNFGTDVSLEKKYELVIIENLNQFISFLSSIDIKNCA